MKVTLNAPITPKRKLKAVMCLDGSFYFMSPLGLMLITSGAMIVSNVYSTLEGVASRETTPTRIYEGDSVTITF